MHPPYGPVDGTLYYDNLRTARATDSYLALGEPVEVYQPTFTQHGFRYAEVTGLRGKLDAADITAIEVGSVVFVSACPTGEQT